MSIAYTTQDDARLATYVSRVAALRPSDWGRLDAIGTQLAHESVTARWRRATLDATRFGLSPLLPDTLAATLAFAGRATFDASLWTASTWWRLTGVDPCGDVSVLEAEEAPARRETAALWERCQRYWPALSDALRTQPGGRCAAERGEAAERCLRYGLHALLLRPVMTNEAFIQVYAVVEPVIPFASLGERPHHRDLRGAP